MIVDINNNVNVLSNYLSLLLKLMIKHQDSLFRILVELPFEDLKNFCETQKNMLIIFE
jgi:hypothetical protein